MDPKIQTTRVVRSGSGLKGGRDGEKTGQADGAKREMAMLWALNLSDGHHSLLDIAERACIPFEVVHEAVEILCGHGLLNDVII